MKGLEDFISQQNEERPAPRATPTKKDPLLGHRSSGTTTCRRIHRTQSDKSRRHSVRHTSVCTPTRGRETHPSTNPESRRSLVPHVPSPEKRHMLFATNNRSSRRQRERLHAGVTAEENGTTNRRRILAADGHLCVHTIGSSGLFGLGHAFHLPQPKVDRMRTGKTGSCCLHECGCQAGVIDVRVRTSLL